MDKRLARQPVDRRCNRHHHIFLKCITEDEIKQHEETQCCQVMQCTKITVLDIMW